MARHWKVARANEPMHYKTAQEQRLHDLALAMTLPWRDGLPQYFWQTASEEQRLSEILAATKCERLPWEN